MAYLTMEDDNIYTSTMFKLIKNYINISTPILKWNLFHNERTQVTVRTWTDRPWREKAT